MGKQKKRNTFWGLAGKLCFDFAKIVFGGIIVAGIMQQESLANSLLLRTFATIVMAVLIAAGFIFHHNERRRK